VREATPEDVPGLLDLMKEFYAEAGYVLDEPEARASFQSLLDEPRLGRVWVAEQDGDVAGYVVVSFVFAMEHGGTMGVVDDFFVRPESRGAGLGTALLTGVRSACAGLGVRALRVEVGHDNAPAQAVYRAAGFETLDRRLMAVRLYGPARQGDTS
jgi:ribosomal protein S18 acetylase RimI-like enzyme